MTSADEWDERYDEYQRHRSTCAMYEAPDLDCWFCHDEAPRWSMPMGEPRKLAVERPLWMPAMVTDNCTVVVDARPPMVA